MKKSAAEIQCCEAVEVVGALMKEAGIRRSVTGKLLPPPIDTKQSSRVTALDKLSNYTGEFDKNTSRHEVSTGYINPDLSEMYDDDPAGDADDKPES